MALVLADRVRDTTTTTGTGTVTLSGTSPTGYQTFGAAIGNGNTTYYTINAGSQWEVGLGTYSSTGPTLARTTVLASSNGGSLVDFSTGTKDVFVTYPAEKSVNQDASGNVGIGTTSPSVKLQVVGSPGTLLRLDGGAGGTGTRDIFFSEFDTAAYGGIIRYDSAADLFTFGTVENSTVINAINVPRSTGNVGIGTTAPGVKFQITQDQAAYSYFDYYNVTNGGGIVWRQIVRDIANSGTTSIDFAKLIGGGFVINNNDTNAANFTAFGVGGTERMRVTSAGNVGIGTSAPSSKLDVVGVASARSDISTGNSPLVAVNTNTGNNTTKYTSLLFQGYDTVGTGKNTGLVLCGPSDSNYVTSYLAFQTRSGDALSERMRIDSSGNMLLGTATAKNRLTVTAGANTNSPTLGSAGGIAYFTNTDVAYGLNVGTSAADGHTWLQAQRTDGTATSYNLTLNEAGGNVGIGTASPGAVLQLNKASGAADLRLSVGGTLYTNIYASSSDVNIFGVTAIPLILGTNNTERMRITSAGDVGIGASAPATKLEVNGGLIAGSENRQTHPPTGPVGFKAQWNYTGGDGETDFYNLYSTASTSFRFYQTTGSGTAQFLYNMRPSSHEFYTGGTERMRIDSSGNVLVGTSTNFGKLSVYGTTGFNADANAPISGSGSFKFRGAASGTTITTYDYLNYTAMQFIRDNGSPTNTVGSITCTDTATTYNTSSDRRLKKDIAPAADAGSVIDAIEIVSHGWKQSLGVVPFGVIAQDLHAIAPQAVHAGDDGDEIENVWGVDYSKLVPMLIKEVQSLRARVAQLEGN